MTPTARQIREAMQNHRRPPRTCAARVMDSVLHARLSAKKKPAEKHFSQDGLKGIYSDENCTPSPRNPHLSQLRDSLQATASTAPTLR